MRSPVRLIPFFLILLFTLILSPQVGSATESSGTLLTQKSRPKAVQKVVFPGAPKRLAIPRIGVDAKVERVGFTRDGRVGIPKVADNVGWFESGHRPGDAGKAVIVGHKDTFTGKAVFWSLSRLRSGDEIFVTDDRKRTRRFLVTGRQWISFSSSLPFETIFGPSRTPKLNLVTCTGWWNRAVGRYSHALVVSAELVKEQPTKLSADRR